MKLDSKGRRRINKEFFRVDNDWWGAIHLINPEKVLFVDIVIEDKEAGDKMVRHYEANFTFEGGAEKKVQLDRSEYERLLLWKF